MKFDVVETSLNDDKVGVQKNTNLWKFQNNEIAETT
jgi:hypothetical protein